MLHCGCGCGCGVPDGMSVNDRSCMHTRHSVCFVRVLWRTHTVTNTFLCPYLSLDKDKISAGWLNMDQKDSTGHVIWCHYDITPHGLGLHHLMLIHADSSPIMHADPCACNIPLMFLMFLFHAFARRITRLCGTLVSDSCALLYDRLVYIDLLYHSTNSRTVLV